MKSVRMLDRGMGTKAVMPKLALGLLSMALLPAIMACDNNFTASFMYSTSAKNNTGLINAYGVNNQTGFLRTLADSPIPSGGRNPVALTAAPNHLYIYVVNRDDSTVLELAIGTDGKLYPYNTYNTTGSFPTGAAVSSNGKFLYVSYTYQDCSTGEVEQNGPNPNCQSPLHGFTTASPGPGGITIFPINSDNSLGSPVDFPIGRAPIAITTSPTGGFVYVIAQDTAATSTTPGQTGNLFAFAADPDTGALSALPGETINPAPGNVVSVGYPSGVLPGGLIEDAAGQHLYVSDFSSNQILTYAIGSNGVPTQVTNAAVGSDVGPEGMTIDPTGKFLFSANYTAGTISAFNVNGDGTLAVIPASRSVQAGTGANCAAMDPLHGVYLYVSNSLSNSMTGEQLEPKTGALAPIIGSPYAASTLPTCMIAVPRVVF